MIPPVLEQSTEPMPDQQQVNGNCLSAGGSLKLNLGGIGDGKTPNLPGFKIVDLADNPKVDIRCDVSKLTPIKSESVDEIYASNILEHFRHIDTVNVLKEWHRVLKPGGILWVSVPNMDYIVKTCLKYGFSEYVRNLIWGDQIHPYAFHYVCFTYGSLAKCVMEAGFSDIEKLYLFPFKLADCSANIDTVEGKLVSLNVKITK